MDFFSTAWNWFKGGSFTAGLAKTALLGYVSRLLNKSTSSTSTGSNEIVDKGVRLQLNPSTENQIPVLYGEAYFGGYITDAQLSADYKKMSYCLTLAELTGNKLSTGQGTSYQFYGVYINNNRVVFKADGYTVDYTLDSSGNQDISYRDLIKIYFYCDQTGVQPQGSSGTTPSPFTTMPGWSALTHSMEDLCYSIVEITYNKDRGVSGLPELTFHVKSDMTLPGDVLADYMTDTVYGAGISGSEIDGSSLTALNSFATTGFSYTNKLGQPATSQILINGLVDTKTDVLTNMQALAEAASAWMNYNIHTGLWNTIINKSGTSVASFTDSNIVGEISVSGTSLMQLNNVADVKYQNTDILDKTDFVKISIPSGDLYDNEPMNAIQINLPFTNKQVVAAKIGLQQLKQARVDKIINFQTDYSYILLNAGDIIDVTSSVYGFTNKLFRIITVTQTEGDAGEILLDFTCLEYDSAVYTYNITEYDVETDGGILGIGSIGQPNTPTVTKTEQSNVPKIVINAVVPSGIVEAMEFWITFDTGIQNDNSRSYIKIGEFSNTNGSILTEDDAVSYTYTGLQQSDFYVKVRGINGVTSGPFSSPSGLIAYVPVVVADTVSDTPVSVGGQLMGLGLLTLLNNLDKLFSESSATGGVFDKVFKVFQNVTGYDLVGNAQNGTLVIEQVPTETPSCYLALSGTGRYPADRSTAESPQANTSGDRAAPTGSYYFTVSGTNKTISAGSGSVKLYKSDGTLVQTIAGSSCTISGYKVTVPFSNRVIGTDYYILMDLNVVTDGTCQLAALNDPQVWNFHTANPQDAIPPVATPPTPVVICPPLELLETITYLYSYYKLEDKNAGTPLYPGQIVRSKDNTLVDLESNIGLKYNQPIIFGSSGTITIQSSSGVHQVFNIQYNFTNNKISELFWISGDTLWLNPTLDFAKGTTYWITMTADCVKTVCNDYGNIAVNNSSKITWTTDPGPSAKYKIPPGDGIPGKPATAGFIFDRNVTLNPSGTASIIDSNNNVVKTIPTSSPVVSIKEG